MCFDKKKTKLGISKEPIFINQIANYFLEIVDSQFFLKYLKKKYQSSKDVKEIISSNRINTFFQKLLFWGVLYCGDFCTAEIFVLWRFLYCGDFCTVEIFVLWGFLYLGIFELGLIG